jgi:hypothetical protein
MYNKFFTRFTIPKPFCLATLFLDVYSALALGIGVGRFLMKNIFLMIIAMEGIYFKVKIAKSCE